MRRASSEKCPVQSAGEGQMAINALQVPSLPLHSGETHLAQTTKLGQSEVHHGPNTLVCRSHLLGSVIGQRALLWDPGYFWLLLICVA